MLRQPFAALAFLSVIFAAAASQAAPSGGAPWISPTEETVDIQQSFKDGLAALEAGDHKKAERKFGEVLTAAPQHPEANYYMGLAKSGRGKDKQAAKYFARAVKARDNFTEAREQLALVSIKLGDSDAARSQLAAIKAAAAACTAETCDAAYVERAAKAVERIEAALAAAAPAPAGIDPDGSAAQSEDESASLARGLDYARLFLDGEDAAAARYRAAIAQINEANYAGAIDDLFLAQAILGPHADILNYLGYAHRMLGRMSQAEDYYRQALALDPNHLGANEYLGELFLETGDIAAARKRLSKLDSLCAFGCAEREALARLIDIASASRSAAR